MKRELQVITCCENKLLYTWQVRVLCNNYREHKLSDKLQVLVFINKNEKALSRWYSIQEDFPEVEVYFYLDNEDTQARIIKPCGYSPLIRPYLLSNHFAALPQLENKAVWYIDPDCILTRPIDFGKYLNDDIVYMSNCQWYVGSKYFDSKINDVKPELKEAYSKIDVLNEAANLIGIDRNICENNFNGSGGAQTLLKNVDSQFFVDLFHSCIKLYNYFHSDKRGINYKYFVSENAGFQTWAIADMNGLLWNLWKRNIKTQCPLDFDFAWNTTPIRDINKFSMYHDAGYNGYEKGFDKYSFTTQEPFNIKIDDLNPDLCCKWYAEQIIKSNPIKT